MCRHESHCRVDSQRDAASAAYPPVVFAFVPTGYGDIPTLLSTQQTMSVTVLQKYCV